MKREDFIKAYEWARENDIQESHAVIFALFMADKFPGAIGQSYGMEWVARYQKGTHLYYSDNETIRSWLLAYNMACSHYGHYGDVLRVI